MICCDLLNQNDRRRFQNPTRKVGREAPHLTGWVLGPLVVVETMIITETQKEGPLLSQEAPYRSILWMTGDQQ
jgi:hypothetical protein